MAAETVATSSALILFALVHELINPLFNIIISPDAEIVEHLNDVAGVHVCHRYGAVFRAGYKVAAGVRGDGLRQLLITPLEIRRRLLLLSSS